MKNFRIQKYFGSDGDFLNSYHSYDYGKTHDYGRKDLFLSRDNDNPALNTTRFLPKTEYDALFPGKMGVIPYWDYYIVPGNNIVIMPADRLKTLTDGGYSQVRNSVINGKIPSWEELLPKNQNLDEQNIDNIDPKVFWWSMGMEPPTEWSNNKTSQLTPSASELKDVSSQISPILRDNKLLQSELRIIEQAVAEKKKWLLEKFLQENNILFEDVVAELRSRLNRPSENGKKYVRSLLKELEK